MVATSHTQLQKELDDAQLKILYILSLYSSQDETLFLQYTGWLVLCYYIMKEGLLPKYKEQLLVYDYKADRRYLWEDKDYMDDVNVLRRKGLVIRARSRSIEYRDINAHQCSRKGHAFLKAISFKKTPEGKAIYSKLSCKICNRLMRIHFDDDQPELKCEKCKKSKVKVEDFLKDLTRPIEFEFEPFFL